MSLLENILEEYEGQGITIPAKLMDSELLQELEEKLERGNPAEVKVFYSDLPDRVDYDTLDSLSDEVTEIEDDLLSEDDFKLIEFFSGETSNDTIQYFLRISGVLVNIFEIVEELEEQDELPANIESSVYLWIYLNLYELILGNMTQFLLKHYREEGNQSEIDYIEGKIEEGEHLTAGKLEMHLTETIGVLPRDNDSVLSEEGSKLLRNKVGHANIYYDDSVDKFILTDGERYSFDEFMEEFEVLLQFGAHWLLNLNGELGGDEDVSETIKEYFEKLGNKVGKTMVKIERSDVDLRDIVLKYKD